MSVSRLQENGFISITRWVIRKDRIKPVSLKWKDKAGWLYAFITSDVVLYIGITGGVLRSRIDNYSYGKEEHDREIRGKLVAKLQDGETVEIHGKSMEDHYELSQEEKRLISEIRPPWNRTL